jgi:hypothetical protein
MYIGTITIKLRNRFLGGKVVTPDVKLAAKGGWY